MIPFRIPNEPLPRSKPSIPPALIAPRWNLLMGIYPLFSSDIPWVSAGPTTAEEIAVREAGALLKVHIGEIRLHIRPDDRIPAEVEHELLRLLDSLFLTLEPLVDACVLDEVVSRHAGDEDEYDPGVLAEMYPKVVALSSLLATQSTVGCHRFLVLSQRAVSFKSTRYLVEQFLKNVRKIFEAPSPTINDHFVNRQARSVVHSQFSETFWKCSRSLFNTLEHHLKGCRKDAKHEALLQLRAFPHAEDKRGAKMDTSVATCPRGTQLHWQEVRFTVASPEIKSTQILDPPGDLIIDICKVARQAYECRQVVSIYVCDEYLHDESQCDDEPINPESEATIPLSSLFDDNVLQDRNRFPPVHKRILALTLAQSLLHLHEGPWIQTDWSAEHVLFMYGKKDNRVYDIHQPYLSCVLTPETAFHTDINDPTHKHPLLLSLGKLLMELDKGERIPITETLRSGKPSLYRTLKVAFDEWSREQLTRYYAEAIEGCLKFPKWLQEHRGVSPEVAYRRVIMDRIVRQLELEVGTFPDTEVGNRDLDFRTGVPVRAEGFPVDMKRLPRPSPAGRVTVSASARDTSSTWEKLARPKRVARPGTSSIPQARRPRPPLGTPGGILRSTTASATSSIPTSIPRRLGGRPTVQFLPNDVHHSYVPSAPPHRVPEVPESATQGDRPQSKGIMMFSDYDVQQPEDKQRLAKTFLEKLEDFRMRWMRCCETAPRAKIAVLDTGLSDTDPRIRALRRAARVARRENPQRGTHDAVRGRRNFTDGPDNDEDGHGSHILALLLTVAPHADLYVAKVARGKKIGMAEQKISEALRWAVDEVKADIISMSFGFDDDSDWDNAMHQAIVDSYAAGRVVFAAASNYGGNSERTYPAKAETVFCIHACDGNGNESGADPTAVKNDVNFSTLGVAVPCGSSGGREVFKTGTSYSTPIAAGIAANIMDLGDWLHMEGRFTAEQRDKLRSFAGIKSTFKLMAPEPRQGYDYVAPWNLWNGRTGEEIIWEKIKEKL